MNTGDGCTIKDYDRLTRYIYTYVDKQVRERLESAFPSSAELVVGRGGRLLAPRSSHAVVRSSLALICFYEGGVLSHVDPLVYLQRHIPPALVRRVHGAG